MGNNCNRLKSKINYTIVIKVAYPKGVYMKDFYTQVNIKLYYTAILVLILIMFTGLLFDNTIELKVGFVLHSTFVFILSITLLLYPKFKNLFTRLIIIISGASLFYTVFFAYPETTSCFILICFIPTISILFFNTRLFYFSLILNIILMFSAFYYMIFLDTENAFALMKLDLMGNFINFSLSQVMIYIIYYLLHERIKQQQIYYEQLQNSERLKTTGQLAAAVAHEIRNPLTTVKGFLQLYKENEITTCEQVHDHFELMISELNTAEQVITQFLTLAKPDKKKEIEVVNVNVSLQSVTDLLKSYGFLRDNTIKLLVEEDCSILANKIEFKQLMINIIKNAFESSKPGDSVTISAVKKNGFVETQVIDHGYGMSEEEVASLGTPFYSLKRSGTGLGLMICYHIVEKYHGTIHFKSEIDKGTTVTICFPISIENQS